MLPLAMPLAFTVMDKVETWALTWMPIILMVALVYLIWRSLKMMPRTKPQQIKPEASGAVAWDDVAGCDEAKHELREVVEFLRDPRRFKKLGARVPKGILLHGPPGTGKTMLAKAVAHESGAHFFSQSASSFVEMFAGLGAARIRRLFAIAQKNTPAILFIDELDAVGLKRGFDLSREKDQTLNQLLVEMDGFAERGDLIVIAASNMIEGLDPALLRPGRFDRQVLVSPPDMRGREQILQVHSRKMPVEDVNLEIVARHTSGLTGADLANLCNEAAIMAGRESRDVIAQQDFDAALERVIAGLQTRRVITPHEKNVIAYHEAGHALISELLPSVPKVHKVSIIPRGRALGFTLNLPEEDRYLMSREDLLDYMKMLLGGYVTEQVVFERVTTGASDDLRRVAEISRSMIYEYGMGSKLLAHLDGTKTDGISQAMLEARDDEQQLLIEEAQFEAREMITENRDLLDRLATELLAKEALDRAEIVGIVAAAKGDGAEVPPVVRLPSIVVEEKLAASSGETAPEKSPRESIGPPPSTSNRAARRSVPPPPVNRA